MQDTPFDFSIGDPMIHMIPDIAYKMFYRTCTIRHKLSNFYLFFKMQIGMNMKRNKICNPIKFNALAIIISNFH